MRKSKEKLYRQVFKGLSDWPGNIGKRCFVVTYGPGLPEHCGSNASRRVENSTGTSPDKEKKLSPLDRSFACISLASIYKGMGVICIQVTWDSGHA